MAVNVWESITGSQVHAPQASWGPQPDPIARALPAAYGGDSHAGLNLLNISKAVGQVSSNFRDAACRQGQLVDDVEGRTNYKICNFFI